MSSFHRVPMAYSRRKFLGYTGGALTVGALGAALAEEKTPSKSAVVRSPLIWANLLHLSANMWHDRPMKMSPELDEALYQPYFRFDLKLWNDITQHMSDVGMNMVVIDVGDGVQYQSHPEIPVPGAWSRKQLREELARLRKLGLEPIPKLNFSTAHHAWLGVYSRQVSTPAYYKVCEDLIAEVVELFDKPRLFHLGYDEETAAHMTNRAYVVVRQHELWWHDFNFFVKQVERRGARPWIWSDYGWRHPEAFLKQMPKTVMQSNWYYGDAFPDPDGTVEWFGKLNKDGYDQIPTGSTWCTPRNFGLMVDYCRKKISPQHLKGFLQTSWRLTLESHRQIHFEAIDQVAAAIKEFAEPVKSRS